MSPAETRVETTKLGAGMRQPIFFRVWDCQSVLRVRVVVGCVLVVVYQFLVVGFVRVLLGVSGLFQRARPSGCRRRQAPGDSAGAHASRRLRRRLTIQTKPPITNPSPSRNIHSGVAQPVHGQLN
jgi:hypothetical protein